MAVWCSACRRNTRDLNPGPSRTGQGMRLKQHRILLKSKNNSQRYGSRLNDNAWVAEVIIRTKVSGIVTGCDVLQKLNIGEKKMGMGWGEVTV